MPGAETVAHDAAVRATATGRRAGADGEDREPSPRVWPLRVSASDGATAHGGLAREPQAGATDLAARGAESTEETAQASTAVAQRWLLHPTAPREQGSCRSHAAACAAPCGEHCRMFERRSSSASARSKFVYNWPLSLARAACTSLAESAHFFILSPSQLTRCPSSAIAFSRRAASLISLMRPS